MRAGDKTCLIALLLLTPKVKSCKDLFVNDSILDYLILYIYIIYIEKKNISKAKLNRSYVLRYPPASQKILCIWSIYRHFYRIFQFIYKYLVKHEKEPSFLIKLFIVGMEYLVYFAFRILTEISHFLPMFAHKSTFAFFHNYAKHKINSTWLNLKIKF